MKCVHCGGEVDSQTVECPYCGSANEEGIRFQQIVSEKIENNKVYIKLQDDSICANLKDKQKIFVKINN